MHTREIIKRNAEKVYHDLRELYLEFDLPNIPDARLLRVVKQRDIKGMLVDMRLALDHIAKSMFTVATNSGQIDTVIEQLSDASDVLKRVERKLSKCGRGTFNVYKKHMGKERNKCSNPNVV